jgi:phage FluMu protein Com
MAETQPIQDVTCVHCGKPFHASMLAPNTGQAGFKCPHCKLFMPLVRVESDADEAA